MCLAAASLVATATWAAPQPQASSPDGSRSATVSAIGSPIAVDGVLDEEIWQTAPTIGELMQRDPHPGAHPSERTDVRLLHDRNALYIGVTAYDSEPDKIVGTEMTRDAIIRNEDRIEIVLDTYGDQRNAFYFATTPAGALVDGLVFANGQFNLEWDAIWEVRTRRTTQGWSAELEIPFKSLSFPSGKSRWGFNISRTIQRKLEEVRWSGARLQTQFFQISEAGEITNLDDLSQGLGLSVRPFLAARWLHRRASGVDTTTGKPGLDMFYSVTPSLKLTATFNTDFGETEVDARQINLTRFSLFFPEKRSFFLEDAGVFSFSNSAILAPPYLSTARAQVIPFFSRQVGLVAGEEVPIDAGLKLTGKIGRTDVGVLNVRTAEARRLPADNLFVARVKRNFLRQSYVGANVTAGDPSRAASASTYGADLGLDTSNFLGRRKNLAVNAYGVRSQRRGVAHHDRSYGASAEYLNDLWEFEVLSRTVEENFDPALGFVSRNNIRLFRAYGRYGPRPKDFIGMQQMFHGAVFNRFSRVDTGQVQSENFFIIFPDWHFKSGDSLHALLSPDFQFERLFEPFEISPGVVLPPGEYRFTRWMNNVATAGKRPLQTQVKWTFGTYWSGHADEVQLIANYKLPPRFTVNVTLNETRARLREGHFTARIATSQVNYSGSPFLTFSNLVQYDNRSRNLSWQGRVRWTIHPGNDLFFVVNQGWIHDEHERGLRFDRRDTQLAAKIQYTFRP